MTEPKIGDEIEFSTPEGPVRYEVIRAHGDEDGPPKGQVDVGRRAPNDPKDGAGKPIGLALTVDAVVWKDLVALTKLVGFPATGTPSVMTDAGSSSRIWQLGDDRGFFVEEDMGDCLLGFKHDDGHETHVAIERVAYDDLRKTWKDEP